jgi:hypothetical protein
MNTKSMSAPAIVVAALTVVGVLLSGCTQPTPGPTPAPATTSSKGVPSPTASAAETIGPPKDSAEAIAAATAATKSYWAVTDQIMSDGGKQPERIDAVSIGQARTYIHESAGEVQKQGISIGGSRSVTVTESYASDATPPGQTVIKNGFVGLTVCNDVTGSKPVNADGTPGDKGSAPRHIRNIEVTYDASAGKWMVSSIIRPGAVIAC